MLQQPPTQDTSTRVVRITCFSCQKNSELKLMSWQQTKKVQCPHCRRKEVVIRST